MPGSRRERADAQTHILRLQAAAQSVPTPSLSMSRSLGYPTEAEVRAGRGEVEGYYRRVSPQEGPGGPPAWSLPPEVEEQLRAPFSASVEPSEEAWAEASLRMMCELLASAGFNALTTRTAHDCRAMAYALLTGRELAS